jgi:hypothetical protein
VAGEIDAFLPFKVKRFFIVHDVPGCRCAASTRTSPATSS